MDQVLHPGAHNIIHHDTMGAGVHVHHHHYYGSEEGGSILSSLKHAFSKKVWDPRTNGVANAFKPGGSAEQFGKKLGKNVASTLIHQGIPAVGSVVGNLAGDFLTENPLGGIAGQYVGKQLGTAAANALGNKVGLGLKPKPAHMVKGSPEAKEHMRKLREKRGSGLTQGPPSRSYTTPVV
jgi:hypothetical protein